MDVQRSPEVKKQKKRRRLAMIILATAALAGISYGLSNLEPALPTVDGASLYSGTVERGAFVRSVRGPGTLVPEKIRWIASDTAGRVDEILIEAGAEVTPDSVILVLTNPELEQEYADAELELKIMESDLRRIEVQLESELFTQEALLSRVETTWKSDQLQAKADARLNDQGLVPDIQRQKSELAAEQSTIQLEKERARMLKIKASHLAQLEVQKNRVEQQRTKLELRRRQIENLKVRPPIYGILQDVPVEEGESVLPGTNLARVAQPDKLKAELRIAETQTQDIVIGQRVEIDTRHGKIPGHVARIDPAVQQGSVLVDVTLDVDELPAVARPDLSVDGVIELEHVEETLYVERPPYGQAFSTVGLFKIEDDATAHRVPVRLGRMSVRFVEILGGLQEGDRVVLSDSSQWDDTDAFRIR